MDRRIEILGTRGIPANHGGFETFAEHFATYLFGRGWDVTVYCQDSGNGKIRESEWCGIRRIHIPVLTQGAMGTVRFDWHATRIASKRAGLKLVLGYNTAIFNMLLRLNGHIHLINMDGLEWKRDKWNVAEKSWLWMNERLGCWLGNHLIADHPEIARHLGTRVNRRKITMIPYGSYRIDSVPTDAVKEMGLQAGSYSLLIARPEPENSILEIVRAFSSKRRDHRLVVLGKYEPDIMHYHQCVIDAASDEVMFAGAIYEAELVAALRFHCRLYVHGHTVGGTNPSLVEALGAGSAVLAHDNVFNRWVAGEKAAYFSDKGECSRQFDHLLVDDKTIQIMKEASRDRHRETFTWESVLGQYEALARKYL